MNQRIYIVCEVNVLESSDLIAPTTIWACVGTSDYSRYSETGIKVAGPIPVLFADRMIEGMKLLLERLGYEVTVKTAVDD